MNWTEEMKRFVSDHADADVERLLLSAHRYPDIDVPFAAVQIAARRKIRDKLPSWYACPDLIMGSTLAAEQCSSEWTARYKARLVVGDSLADLTGGMGVDCYYMSRNVASALYVERDHTLCEAARHNFAVLHAVNIVIREGDGIADIPNADTLYADPARRTVSGGRVYDLTACTPDVVAARSRLMAHCSRLVVKISPMADLNLVARILPGIEQAHVVAVRGECKEVVLVLGETTEPMRVECVDLLPTRDVHFSFTRDEEAQARPTYADGIGRYLYEPSAALLKAGAFRCVATRYGVEKLDVNTHLYTSDAFRADFPGRAFAVEACIPFSAKTLRTLGRDIPQANIAVRNFPLAVDALRARTGIRDGGDTYLFAATLRRAGRCLLKCRKAVVATLIACLLPVAFPARAQTAEPPTMDDLLAGLRAEPLAQWYSGKPFVHFAAQPNLLLVAETQAQPDTTDYAESLWRFDAVVTEDNWLGQPASSLRFIAPDGRAYRFELPDGRDVMGDTSYCPIVGGLYSWDLVMQMDSLLRARTLYILIYDDRISPADSAAASALTEKYVPVVIDSVRCGTETNPFRIHYSRRGHSASLCACLPATERTSMGSPLTKLFSPINPRTRYPDTTDECWQAICEGRLRQGMTAQEVRAAWGRPEHFERHITYSGILERWFYRNGRVLELWDNVLQSVAGQ